MQINSSANLPEPKTYISFPYKLSKQVSFNFSDKKKHNIELHIKTGDAGRLDVWFDHKLMFSYRSPSAFANPISHITFGTSGSNATAIALSSFILQDTRRIGYEKFVKLNIDPAT